MFCKTNELNKLGCQFAVKFCVFFLPLFSFMFSSQNPSKPKKTRQDLHCDAWGKIKMSSSGRSDGGKAFVDSAIAKRLLGETWGKASIGSWLPKGTSKITKKIQEPQNWVPNYLKSI